MDIWVQNGSKCTGCLPQLRGRPGDVVTATAQHHKTLLECISLGQEKIEIQPLEYGSCWTRIAFVPWLGCKIINQNSAKSGTITVLYRSGITYITQQLDLFVKHYIITLETPFQVITCKSKLLFLKYAKCLTMWINHAFVNQHPTDGFSSHSDFSCHSKQFCNKWSFTHTPMNRHFISTG